MALIRAILLCMILVGCVQQQAVVQPPLPPLKDSVLVQEPTKSVVPPKEIKQPTPFQIGREIQPPAACLEARKVGHEC